jgi:phage tail-like protein
LRGVVPGLVTPVPLLQRLPGVLQDDPFMQRFVTAFDEGLAPIIATLDGLGGYVDPWLAPADFLNWLAGWVGLDELDDAWTLDQRRAVVAGAALVHRQRGTVRGVREALSLTLDARVEVTDSGGCTWSPRPGADPPGEETPSLRVRIFVNDPDAVDTRRIEAAIEAVKPAHLEHSYELLAEPRHAKGG